MGGFLSFAKSWWAQVFMLLLIIAILDRSTAFKTDVGAIGTLTDNTIKDLKV